MLNIKEREPKGVGTACPYQRNEEGVFEAKAGCDGQHRVQTPQQGAEQNQLPDVRLDRKAGQVHPQRCQPLVPVQGVLTRYTATGIFNTSDCQKLER